MHDSLTGKKRIHFIGIGGAGMCALAEILHGEGFAITGSDNNESDNLARVRELGIPVTLGHRAENVGDAELVVHTAAVHEDNPEMQEARRRGIPVIERGPMLGEISRRYKNCVAVSGTHGKTTATSMITQVLVMAGFDPTAAIGGRLPFIGGNSRHGQSDIMVCEACEYVNSYHSISPAVAVVLNIDSDHLEFFKTIDNLVASFRQFAGSASRCIVYNGDDARTCRAVEGLEKPTVTFGLTPKNDFYAENIRVNERCRTSFDVYSRGERVAQVQLQVPGEHNVLNALACVAACRVLEVPYADIERGLDAFAGAHRRFERVGEFGGVVLADDYAHHPAELAVTLRAAKSMGYRQVWAVFQPFTFSRTYMLLDDFAAALKIADHVVLSPIMGSREVNTYDIHSEDLAAKIPGCVALDSFQAVADYVKAHAQPGDLVITLGCGDIYKAGRLMLEA